MKKLFLLQSLVLLAGTLFAWFTVYSDFTRFYHLYGTLARIKGCVVPNPITTPCFYGAFAFLGGLIWSLIILRQPEEKRFDQQKKLNILLIGSTIFAWSNLSLEVMQSLTKKAGDFISCSGVPATNIFATACFIGSTIFLGALVVSLMILKKKK